MTTTHRLDAPAGAQGTTARFSASSPLRCAVFVAMLAGAAAPPVRAQSGGSIGGTIGGDAGGSIGGRIGGPAPAAPAAPVRPQAPVVRRPVVVPRQQRAVRVEPVRRRGRGEERRAGGYDGTWSLSTASNCAGNGSGVFRVSGSRLFARNARGSVSAAGSVYSTERFRGMTAVYTGRLYGNSGSGSYQRADGCTGQWTAAR